MIRFLHIPKTGGTTVRATLDAAGIEYSAGHWTWDDLAFEQMDYTFTVMRDPVERMISLYSYIRADREHYPVYQSYRGVHPLDVTFIEFLQGRLGINSNVDNGTVRRLCSGDLYYSSHLPVTAAHVETAKVHLKRFDRVGFTDQLDRFLRVVCGDIGIDYVRVAPQKVSVERYEPIEAERVVAAQMLWAARDLYEWARAQWE